MPPHQPGSMPGARGQTRSILLLGPGKEAWHVLNPVCVLRKAKYALVSKHEWPNFIVLCTSYLQQPAWCSRLVAIWILNIVWKDVFVPAIVLILVPATYTEELLHLQCKYFEHIIFNYPNISGLWYSEPVSWQEYLCNFLVSGRMTYLYCFLPTCSMMQLIKET